MPDKTQPTAHAEITAPISADLRRIDDAGAQPVEALLFEHKDGRHAVNPDTAGDPDWHRVGPVMVYGHAALQAAPPATEVPEIAANAPDLPPPMGIRNDRDMLNYLMGAFDSEAHYCERCGHGEDTKDMDSASLLREYLAAAPAQAVAVPMAALPERPKPQFPAPSAGVECDCYTGMQMLSFGFACAMAQRELAVAPAQEHATQGQTFSQWWDAQRKVAAARAPGDDWMDLSADDREQYEAAFNAGARSATQEHATQLAGQGQFQQRVQPWLLQCFGADIAGDKAERNHRFLEEALELVQSCGCTVSEAHQLVDYVFGRPVGEPAQEVGGVMVTLAALCYANCLDMHAAGETELERISVPAMTAKIKAKQAAKPKHSPLPAAPTHAQEDALDYAELQEIQRAVEQFADCGETDVDYALLMRAAQAGYLKCTHFQVMNESALNLDAASAAQGGAA